MKWWSLVLVVLVMAARQAPAPQAPAGTASIKGQVVDRQTGAPIARAIVILSSTRTRDVQQNLTDERGQFEFARLAADRYDLRVTPGEYRATHVYGEYTSPTTGRWGMLELRDGEARTDIVISLPPARAISGRVTNDDGIPLANVEVSLTTVQGNRVGFVGAPRMTDDRGMFRLYGLASGRYRLCAATRQGVRFDAQTQQRRPQYVQTCYPSATDANESTEVSITDQDVSGVELRLQRRPTFRLTGQVVGADGVPPENVSVMVTHIQGSGSSGTGTHLTSGGSFSVSNVVPGQYDVSAQLGRDGYSGPDDRDPQWGAVRFEVTSADVEGIVVRLKTAATLKGKVTFEDRPEKPGDSPMQVIAQPILATGSSRRNPPPAPVAEDGDFELRGLFGPMVLRVSGGLPPPGYVVKSVLYRGSDIGDKPVEFDGNPAHSVEIVLTNRTAELSGQVTDDVGRPASGATVLVFPVDVARWPGFQARRSGTSEQGRYRLAGFVEGDYFVVAVRAAELQTVRLPDDYARLAGVAERVTVLERERRTADLPLTAIPPAKKIP